jgi:WD40 repeat protein
VAVLSGGAWSGFEAAACGALAWSGGGHYLAAGTSAGVRCWRFPQADTVQLSGGPAAPSCVSFSADGGIVAVSGGSRAACWALGRADAPPAECGVPSSVAVTRVAFHPTRPVLALGYGSGAVLLGQPGSEGVLLVRGPGGGAIIALAWSADGEALAFGTEGGMIGLVRLPELLFRPATAAASPAARAGAPA